MSYRSLERQRLFNGSLTARINQFWAKQGIDANAHVELKQMPIRNSIRKGVRVRLKKVRYVSSNEIVSNIKPIF